MIEASAMPIAAWHTEHQHFNGLLEQLRRELDVFHRGERPDYERMSEIVVFLRDYGDKVHHPREDVAFERLARHCPDMALPLARLAQEHRVIAQAGQKLLDQIDAVLGDAMVPRGEVEVALATYLVYYGNHIAKEEEDVLTRAAQYLTAQDWEAVGGVARALSGRFCNNLPMLEAQAIECERGRRTLFRGLSFALAPGELLRIAGPNGSGKTSLLRILCGLLAPTAGEVRWQGAAIRSLQEDYARQLVYLGHAPAVKDDLNAAENLDIACRLAGRPALGDAIAAALARFDVPPAPMLRRLSQGQRRRAALARLHLAAAAPLWLLDEPFAALDARGIASVQEAIAQHAAQGGALVFTTHQDAGVAATRVIELG